MKKVLMLVMVILVCLSVFSIPGPLVKAETINPSSTTGLYAGSTNPGKVWEYKGGTSWESITDQPSELGWSVTSIIEFEGKLYAATISNPDSYSSTGKVYRYEGGKTWTPVVSGLAVNQVTFLVVYEGNLYAGTATPARLYKYEPATASWTKVLEYGSWFGFRSAYVRGDWLYLGEWYYDRFARWDGVNFQIFQPYYWGSCIYSFEEYGDYLYAGAYGGRIYRVTYEPPTATSIWSPPQSQYAWTLKAFKERLYIGFDAGGTGVAPLYRYDGTTFAPAWSYSTTTSDQHEGIISMATDGTYLYVGVGGQAVGFPSHMSAEGTGKIYRSSDGINFEPASGIMGTGIQVLYKPQIGVKIADLAVDLPEIPPAQQSAQPNELTLVATVRNFGPDTASNVRVQFFSGNPNNGGTQIGTEQVLGDIITGGQASASVIWVLSGYVENVMLYTRVYSASVVDPNEANNIVNVLLNGAYFMNFRVDRDGYSFQNQGSNPGANADVGWALFRDTFGASNVEWNIFGRVIHKPMAQRFYDTVYVNLFPGGNCYGMSTTSLRFYGSLDNFRAFDPQANNVNGMSTNYAHDNPTWRNIEKFHGYQLGTQVQNSLASQTGYPKDALEDIKSAMRSGGSDPRILAIWGIGGGHAIVPYRVVETTRKEGAATSHKASTYAYDNNLPNRAGVVVNFDLDTGRWNYEELGWGGTSGVKTIPRSLNDGMPNPPWFGGGLFLASVSGSANMLNTDSLGRRLGYKNGRLVEEIPHGMPLRPLFEFPFAAGFPEAYVLPAGEYATSLSGKEAGSATANIFNSVALLTFTSSSMMPTTVDTINLSQDGKSVRFRTSAANERYSAMLYRDFTSSTRRYTIGNTELSAGEQITLQLSDGGTSLEITNEGNRKSYDLLLEQLGASPGVLTRPQISIDANLKQLIEVLDWNDLGSTQVVLFIKDLNGRILNVQTLQATIGSTRAFVAQAYEMGKITDLSVRDGLDDKLDAAGEAQVRGDKRVVNNLLGAFINLVEAQRGKAIELVVGDILIQDANYIRQN